MSAVFACFTLIAIASVAAGEHVGPVQSCSSATGSRPGFGVAYRGVVENDDYKLRAVIPRGLAGWGAASIAPFHGFTIFLNAQRSACIQFEIHRRVDLGGSDSPAPDARNIQVGNVKGFENESTGSVANIVLRNVWITFSVPKDKELLDGYVLFITPPNDLKKYEPVFESFVPQLRFN